MIRKCADLFRGVVRLFYPPLCMACDASLVRGERFVCTRCLAEFPYAETLFSPATARIPFNYYALFHYNKHSRYKKLVHAVKYRSGRELGYYLGSMLGRRLQAAEAFDAVVPVPLHPGKERKRGYNQSVQIAAGIAEVLNKPLWDDVAVRIRNNPSQTGKNAADRRENVEDVFRLLDPDRIRGRHLLLVDDVITTGATLCSFLNELSRAGEVRFTAGCLGRTEI